MYNPVRRAARLVHPVLSGALALGLALAGFGCDRGDDAEATRCPEPEATERTVDAPAPAPSVGTPAPDPTTVAHAPESAPVTPKLAGPKPPPDPATAEQLRIKRLIIATGVAGREPVGATSTLSLAEIDRVYAFVEVDNPLRGASEVVVTFEAPSGDATGTATTGTATTGTATTGTATTGTATTGNVRLDVGSAPRWRTWAYTRGIKRAGEWTAVVSTPNGKELARQSFTVTEA